MSILIDYPWFFTLFCLLLGIAYALLLYFRRRDDSASRAATATMMLLRAISVTLIAFLLLAPLVKRQSNRKEKPIILIAHDNSQSILLNNDSAFYKGDYQSDVQALTKQLSEDFDVQQMTFGSQTALRDNNPLSFDEVSTDMAALFSEVKQRYFHRNIGALIVASDGIHNRGSNPVAAAAELAVPIYTIAMGDTSRHPDIAITNLRYNRIAFLGNTFPIEITGRATLLNAKSTTLSVSSGGRQLFAKRIDISDNNFSFSETVTVEAAQAGMADFIVELSPVQGEHSTANNRVRIQIDIIDGHQKVAIIANAPHPDIAALKNALQSDLNYEVQTFTADKATTLTDDYNLFIFHQLPSRSHSTNIDVTKLLKKDVPAIFILGSQTDLARFNALHAGLEVFSRINKLNEATPLFNNDFTLFNLDKTVASRIDLFPPLASPFGDYKLSGNAQTLFFAKIGNVNSKIPLVAATQVQGMRYAIIAGEGLWRWRLADYQHNSSHDNFDGLINKLATFVTANAGREHFVVNANRLFAQNEPVTLEAQLFDENYELTNRPEVQLLLQRLDSVTQPASYNFNRNAHSYSLNLGSLPPGSYRYQASTRLNGHEYTASGGFSIESLQIEATNTVADHALLNTISSNSGGFMVNAHNVKQIADALKQRDDLHTLLFSETHYSDMLNLPLLFIAIVLLLAAEWIVRKYNGI